MLLKKGNVSLGQNKEALSPRAKFSRSTLIFMTIFAILASLASLTGGILANTWPFFLLSGAFAVSAIMNIFTLTSIWDAPASIKILVSTLSFEISFALAAGVISFAYGSPFALIAIVVAFLFAAVNQSGWLNEWIIGLGIVGALSCLVLSVLAPLPQVASLSLDILIIILDAAAIIVMIQLIRLGLLITTLRLKLVMYALSLAILPLIVLAVINLQSIRNTVSLQSNDTLRVATELTVDQIDNFFTSNLSTLQNQALLPVFKNYLQLSQVLRSNSSEELELSSTLSSFQTQNVLYTPSYGVIDLVGIDVYDTNINNIGNSEFYTDYFQSSLTTKSSFVSTVEFIPNTRQSYIYFISPILDEDQNPIGFLRMKYNSLILQSELGKTAGLIGAHSYPILLDENGIRLADTSNPDLIYHSIQTLGSQKYSELLSANRIPSYISESQINSPIQEIASELYVTNLKPYQFFDVDLQSSKTGVLDKATYGTLTTQKWNVVYLQEQTALVSAQQNLTKSSAIVAVLIAAIVSLLITILASLFTQPIIELTRTAQTIADGDLNTHVTVKTNDEIGAMGKAFNSMALQLKSSFDNLERRVNERTKELAKQNDALRFRSRQLQTVTDVARSIVSTNDMESLLTLVTQLISDRFNYYHAGIFLLDDKGEYAVFRASNSKGGQRMLNRQHKLKVGQVGIVGYVTATGNPRIATDVGKDAVFFNNPDLPETKSEMALPLKIENRVIGALDIQSTESNSFSEDDIKLFTTLADQVSVAINNNKLLNNTQKALAEAQDLHRQYLNQEWTKRAVEIGRTSYKYSVQGLTTYEDDLPEVKMVFESGRPVTRSSVQKENSQTSYSTLAVPILLRGEVIGVIHLQENEESNFNWSENELITVQTLADQLAQSLESARLFEQTIRRADRERRVLEITSKIRSTNDPQQMLEITLEELKRHLGASQAQIVFNLPGQTTSTSQLDMNTINRNKEGE